MGSVTVACTYGLEEIIAYLAHTAMTHPADGRRGERWFCTHHLTVTLHASTIELLLAPCTPH